MKDDTLLLLAAIGIGLYVYGDAKKLLSPKPWSQNTTVSALTNAGVQIQTLASGKYIPVTGGTVRIQEGWNPNYAQRALIGLDTIIPGDWLTRAVLGI